MTQIRVFLSVYWWATKNQTNLVLLRRFHGKKCDDRPILNLDESAHALLRWVFEW